MPEITAEYFELVELNDQFRKSEKPPPGDLLGGDVFPLREAFLRRPGHGPPLQTLMNAEGRGDLDTACAPEHLGDSVGPLDVNDPGGKNKFAAKFPGVAKALYQANGRAPPGSKILAAGGSVARALADSNPENWKSSDFDFFFVTSGSSEREFWGLVRVLIDELFPLAPNDETGDSCVDDYRIRVQRGLVRILAYDGRLDQAEEFQFILRAYPSVSTLLHGFDVPSCCVAYDGAEIYTTSLGAYAAITRINLVVPAYRSTTYERRLVKYFNRGWALGFPDLGAGFFEKAYAACTEIKFPHLWLRVQSRTGFSRATGWGKVWGEARQPPEETKDYYNISDYEGMDRLYAAMGGGSAITMALWNFNQVLKGNFEGLALQMAKIQTRRQDFSYRPVDKQLSELFSRLESSPLTVDYFTQKGLSMHESISDSVVSNLKVGVRPTPGRLATLGLGSDEISAISVFGAAIAFDSKLRLDSHGSKSTPHSDIKFVQDALNRVRSAGEEAIKDHGEKAVGLWITVNPARQFTGSLNPRCEDPADWYGEGVPLETLTPPPYQSAVGAPSAAPVRGGSPSDHPSACGDCKAPEA